MRALSFALVLPLALAGCQGRTITGPEAQRAVAEAKASYPKLPSGVLVLVDGVKLSSDKSVNDLDPADIETVEIVKGLKAEELYGVGHHHGVILITTKRE